MTKPIATFASNLIDAHEANERKLDAARAMLAALKKSEANYLKLANEDFKSDPVAAASWGRQHDIARAAIAQAEAAGIKVEG